jgi:serine phosphatase RsbU (regulator of sigma subunit)
VWLANAGHPAPLHLRRVGRGVERCQTADGPGPALGLIPEFAYETTSHQLAAGDSMLLFTDGVFEVEGASGEEFGQVRLRAAVARRVAEPTPQLLDGLLADVKAYRPVGATEALPDDVCVVAVDFAG